MTSRLNLTRPIKDAIKITIVGQSFKISVKAKVLLNDDFKIINAATHIIPITAQWIPCITACVAEDCRIKSNHREAITINIAGTPKIAIVEQSAPQNPATLYPINVALIKIGPGVTCPRAMPSVNSCDDNQLFSRTTILPITGIKT